MKKLLGALLLIPALAFGQKTFWTNIQQVITPINTADTFILGVVTPTPTNELMTAQSVLNWTGLGPTNFALQIGANGTNQSFVAALQATNPFLSTIAYSNLAAGANITLTPGANSVLTIASGVGQAYPTLFTNFVLQSQTGSGSFTGVILSFTTPAGGTNSWQFTLCTGPATISGSYQITPNLSVNPDGGTLATTAFGSAVLNNGQFYWPTLNVRVKPNTVVTFETIGSGSGSFSIGQIEVAAYLSAPN